MNSAASLLQPDANPALYINSVLMLYVDLPDTPSRTNTQDQRQARSWFDRGVPLAVVETALLLACLRRRTRPAEVPPLPTYPFACLFRRSAGIRKMDLTTTIQCSRLSAKLSS